MPDKSYNITPKQITNVLKSRNLKLENKEGDIEYYSGHIKNKKVKVSVDTSTNYSRAGMSSIFSQANISEPSFLKSISSTKSLRIQHTSGKNHRKNKKKKKGSKKGKGSRKK